MLASLNEFSCYAEGNSVMIPPALGTFGTMGRNMFRGPGLGEWDLSLIKDWNMEPLGVQIRAEAYNILNHPNLANPYDGPSNIGNNDPSSPSTFGCGCATVNAAADVGKEIGSSGSRTMRVKAHGKERKNKMAEKEIRDEGGRLTRRGFLQTAGTGLALASSTLPIRALGCSCPPLQAAGYDESAVVAPDGAVDGLRPKFVDVPAFGTTIRTRYYEAGDPSSEPLVLIHGEGWSGHSSANVWSKNIPGLGQQFHVFAADKLASGMTGNPPADKDYDILGEIEHMYQFIQTMKLGKVHLAGQSRGGGCAFFLAYHHPEIVRTLIVVDTLTAAPQGVSTREQMFAHCPKAPDGAEWRCRLESLSFHPEAFSDAYFAAGMYMAGLPKARETVSKLKAGLAEQAYGMPWKKAVLDRVRTEGPLQMPILLYWARNDPSAVLERGHALYEIVAAKNARARMLTMNKAGHFHFREYPEEWNYHVTRFIQYWRKQA